MKTCQHCRAEQEDLSRRTLLKRVLGVAGAALVLNFFPSEFLRRTAAAATNAGKTLVVVFQRGGNDGLNTIVPYTDPRYYVVRPSALSGAGNIGIPLQEAVMAPGWISLAPDSLCIRHCCRFMGCIPTTCWQL